MKITLQNPTTCSSISISDDSLKTDNEIMIEVSNANDSSGSWHTITNMKDFDDLIDQLQEFRRRMKKNFED